MCATTFGEDIIYHTHDFWLFATTILVISHTLNDRVLENDINDHEKKWSKDLNQTSES